MTPAPEIGERGSTWSSVRNVGAGAPGGVSEACARESEQVRASIIAAPANAAFTPLSPQACPRHRLLSVFIVEALAKPLAISAYGGHREGFRKEKMPV